MKRTFFAVIASFAALTLSGCALFYPNIDNSISPSDPMSPSPTESQTTSPSPEPTQSESPTPQKAEAKPRLLFYEIDAANSNLVLIGEVINFAEDGGECIITYYSGNTPIIQERVPAEHNVTTTQCFPLNISLSRLPKGKGDVVIGYESEKYFGESEKFEVIIP